MSKKFNSKNFSYDAKPPPFLAALQAQAAGHSSNGPDPLSAGRRRAGKKRSASEDAEDVPLVVDEQGNVVALTVDKDGAVAAGQHDDPRDVDAAAADGSAKTDSAETAEKQDTESKISIGGRKRKFGKVVGGDEDADDKEKATATETRHGKDAPGKGDKDAGKDGKDGKTTGDKKPKKKSTKIKLSFDED